MALDMTLYAEMYVSGWRHNPEAQQARYKEVIEALGWQDKALGSPALTITVPGVYWRNAYATDTWFWRLSTGGTDYTQKIPVTVEDLRELVSLCKQALVHLRDGFHGKAAELLPPSPDPGRNKDAREETYKMDLLDTVTRVERFLDDYGTADGYYYQAG